MIDKDLEDKLMQNTFSHGTGLMRMSLNKNGGIDVDVVDPKDYRYWIREPQISINTEVVGHIEPQREWVGMTKDEFKFIASKYLLYREAGLEFFQEELEQRYKENNT